MKNGYTFIEIIVVSAILVVLLSLTMLGLNSVQQNTYQSSSIELLLSDLRLQQLKSMSGDTSETGVHEPYGIYFGLNNYVLFRGSTYIAGDPTNFTVDLNPNTLFSAVEFAGSQVVFTKGSGEIQNYVNGNDTITITNDQSEKNTSITLNSYGIITQIN